MKDKLLFGTIGLLVGIVVMQWTMPSGQATVVTPPVGDIVAMAEVGLVLTTTGEVWTYDSAVPGWVVAYPIPLPVADVQFIWGASLVTKTGDMWVNESLGWVNRGQPPVGPIATDQSTWGKIKSTFSKKGDQQ